MVIVEFAKQVAEHIAQRNWEEVWEELEGMLCDMDCNNCEFADKLYFKDNENGEFYEYKTSTIVNCMKYNDFVIGGEFLSNL